eukprot:10717511-Ditylum_brightwellii.AAC.1
MKEKDDVICCLRASSNKLQSQVETLHKKVSSLEIWKSKKLSEDSKEASKVRMTKMRHEMHMEKQNAEKQSRRELQQHASNLKIKQQKEKEREKRGKEELDHKRRIKRARDLQHNNCQQFQYDSGGYNLPSMC